MTDPVILLGTQSNGETLPVQVDAFGRLVAEGLQGPEGPEGPTGPPGPEGPSFELPPDPYEGALLGWLNNELAWIGTPPVPIPPGVFGPITDWNSESGILQVEGPIPPEVGNGVYLWQCERDGTLYMNGYLPTETWTDYATGSPNSSQNDWDQFFGPIFGNGNHVTVPRTNASMAFNYEIEVADEVTFIGFNDTNQSTYGTLINGSIWLPQTVGYGDEESITSAALGGSLRSVQLINSSGSAPYMTGMKIDNQFVVNSEYSLQMRVNQVMEQNIIGNVVNDYAQFEVGKYLKIPQQRVAPWVLYGNDPTSLIDHLRSS